ncbi:hypothetical protein K4K55_006983 [Colletotrichum sp. SAR 10_96]|nr:hypothetical protein K4K55_006983 [Colletotrichum sp. SAR 10_96]
MTTITQAAVETNSLEPTPQERGYLMPPDIETNTSSSSVINDYLAPYEVPHFQITKLEGAEHRATAQNIKMRDIHGRILPHDDLLATVSGVNLTFGHIVALAGDFYTNREGRAKYFPIADSDDFVSKGTKSKMTTAGKRFDNAMHDDDSATGILVQNRKGDQWIEYGDKQFFEPQAAVNRARCMNCLEESTNEIYQVGYLGGKPIETWEKNQSWFAAMKLIPRPMTSLSSPSWLESWGGYDMHNPAPLWVSPGGGPDVESGWTFRKDINDHSNFGTRPSGSLRNTSWIPGFPKATDECYSIKEAKFRTADQFPEQSAIKGLLSGGLIQVQDLNANSPGKGTCINFWSPVSVDVLNETFNSWTLRNRLIDQEASPCPGEHVIHWMRSHGHVRFSTITGFSWTGRPDGSGDIVYKSTSYGSKDFSVSGGGDAVPLKIGQSWGMKETMSSTLAVVLESLPNKKTAKMTRFSQGFFLTGSQDTYDEMDMLALVQLKDQGIRIGIASNRLEGATQHRVDRPTGKAPYGFVKRFRGAKPSKDAILLARRTSEGGSMMVDFCRVDFDNTGNPSMTESAFSSKCDSMSKDASILVGDALGQGSDQAVVVISSTDVACVDVYGSQSNKEAPMRSLGSAKLPLSKLKGSNFPILMAFMPTITAHGGLDILQISRFRDGNSTSLIFHTYLRAGQNENYLPYSEIKTKSCEDKLSSKSPEHYFNIKWMPVRYKTDNNASACGLLEIFSWYGVLGARLFGSRNENSWDYELLGQLPYLGQTSIGAGQGCYGDWGHGFLAWSEENEWVDVNLFKRSDERDTTAGSWAMRWDDMERPDVRGWEVEKRPFR